MRHLTAALLTAALLVPAPAFAGASEDAYLSRLVGVWSGKGTLSGAETGKVSCTLTIRQRTDGVNFSVKCEVPEFGPQNFSGVISYNDATGKYEARSSGGDVTVGAKKGSSIVFTADMKGMAEGTSVMTISNSRVVVDATVRRPGGTADIKSHIEMTR